MRARVDPPQFRVRDLAVPAVAGIAAHLLARGRGPGIAVCLAVGIDADAALCWQLAYRQCRAQWILLLAQVAGETDPETAPGGLSVLQGSGSLDDDAQLSAQPFHAEWTAQASPGKLLTPELAGHMAEAGCRRLVFGMECGSDRILRALGKPFTREQAEAAFAAGSRNDRPGRYGRDRQDRAGGDHWNGH